MRKILMRKGHGGDNETSIVSAQVIPRAVDQDGCRVPTTMSKGVGQSVIRDPDGDRTHNHKTTHDYKKLQQKHRSVPLFTL